MAEGDKGIVLREDKCPCCQGSGKLVIWLPSEEWETEFAFRTLELQQRLKWWQEVRQCKSCLLPFAGHVDVPNNDTCSVACHQAWLDRGRRPLVEERTLEERT